MRATLVVLVAVVAAGCGGEDAAEPVATTRVIMPESYRFEPEAIQIAAGSEVTWRNEDNFTHTVKVQDGTVHEVEPGEEVRLRFSRKGTFEYLCTLHPSDMSGRVIVR